jgi:endonuclease-3
MRTDPQRVKTILLLLKSAYPNARTELAYRNPFELLIATILSAQCTDERVNRVTPALFKRFPTPRKLAEADLREIEEIIRPTGFYKSKARSIIGCAKAIAERFGGEVPRTLEELVTLPGVWRKTANVILGNCFGKPAIVVDTHVKRVARRLELSTSENPDRIEADLARIFPEAQWTKASHRVLLHGRYTCKAKSPLCTKCPLVGVCEAPEKFDVLRKSAKADRRL